MKQIKYSYCLNEKKELTHISNVTIENKHNQTFYCLECGNEMIAKIGKIKIPHFAHKSETACDGESYLHKLAKRKICEKFNSDKDFFLTFIRSIPCEDGDCCPINKEHHFLCYDYNERIQFNLKKYFKTCQEEVSIENFRPDILLPHPDKKKSIFIEIYKTHKSEDQKIYSDYRVIETIKIESEKDIDNIIEKGFIEGENCNTYNFSPKLPPSKRNNTSGLCNDRFILYNHGGAWVKECIPCNLINKRIDSKSIIELNILHSFAPFDNPYAYGLAYLIKKGYNIKNCIICKYYKFNDFYNHSICILYKQLKMDTPIPKQTKANTCPRYEIRLEINNGDYSDICEVTQ